MKLATTLLYWRVITRIDHKMAFELCAWMYVFVYVGAYMNMYVCVSRHIYKAFY